MEKSIFNVDIKINDFKNKIQDSRINIEKLKGEKKLLKEKSCLKFRKKHKRAFLFLDILLVTIILSNLGALLITNMLVVKVEPEVEFREANPAAAEVHNFEVHPEANRVYFQFILFVSLWSILTGFYLLWRNRIDNNFMLNLFGIYIIFYGIALYTDFINNLGYLLGVKIFGG